MTLSTTEPAIELGLIEGYYGRAWSWADRGRVVQMLAGHGYRFHWYAPKAATALRRQWRQPIAEAEWRSMQSHRDLCRSLGVKFGLGLSPHEFDSSAGSEDWSHLRRWLKVADTLAIDDLALLFDDIRGDDSALAARQLELVARASEWTRAKRVLVCPTYYSLDPILDKVFGQRPAEYLMQLGRGLDRHVGVFWTGEEVCARQIDGAHLDAVAQILQRKPVLWDNYPVNDGARMSQHLHLRAFSGRPAGNASRLAAHAINPALQPTLTCIPALTLAASYRDGEARYQYGRALRDAARAVLGESLADQIILDLIALQDTGLDRLGERHAELQARYGAIDHPAAREIVDWLNGGYRITDEIVQTQ